MKKIYTISAICAILFIGCSKNGNDAGSGKGTITYNGDTYQLDDAALVISESPITAEGISKRYSYKFDFSSKDNKNKVSVMIVAKNSEPATSEYFLTTIDVNVAGHTIQSNISASDIIDVLSPSTTKISLSYSKRDNKCDLELKSENLFDIKWEGVIKTESKI